MYDGVLGFETRATLGCDGRDAFLWERSGSTGTIRRLEGYTWSLDVISDSHEDVAYFSTLFHMSFHFHVAGRSRGLAASSAGCGHVTDHDQSCRRLSLQHDSDINVQVPE